MNSRIGKLRLKNLLSIWKISNVEAAPLSVIQRDISAFSSETECKPKIESKPVSLGPDVVQTVLRATSNETESDVMHKENKLKTENFINYLGKYTEWKSKELISILDDWRYIPT